MISTMISTTTLTAASGQGPVALPGHAIEDAAVTSLPGGAAYWVDPGTDLVYPLSYRAYRRAREAEEKTPPRHRTLGPDVDSHVWRRGLSTGTPETEVSLTVRPDTPLRVRRMLAQVLRSIRRGRAAGDAIRHVSRRFGLAQTRARAFITASIGFEVRPHPDGITSGPWG
jgi:hypothetical protein